MDRKPGRLIESKFFSVLCGFLYFGLTVRLKVEFSPALQQFQTGQGNSLQLKINISNDKKDHLFSHIVNSRPVDLSANYSHLLITESFQLWLVSGGLLIEKLKDTGPTNICSGVEQGWLLCKFSDYSVN